MTTTDQCKCSLRQISAEMQIAEWVSVLDEHALKNCRYMHGRYVSLADGEKLPPHATGLPCSYKSAVKCFYFEDLAWCGCGSPDEALTFMRDVLRAIANCQQSDSDAALRTLLPDTPLALSYRYMLDALKLTEHGTSVFGGWLTEKGEHLLKLLEGCDIEAVMDEDDHG